MSNDKLWGIDLGGTKIEAVVLDSENKEVLARLRVPTEAALGYEHILDQIEQLVKKTAQAVGAFPDKMGMGTPGAMDAENAIIKNSNTVCLNNRPFKEDVEKRLNFPVKMSNDANCFALAETHLGIVKDVAPNAQVVFGIIIGTGVGGGLVVNGQCLNGLHGIAGEWGHNFLDSSGGSCYCGQVGCVERIISGPALEKYYHNISGHKKRLREINSIRSQDSYADETIKRLVKMFGKGLAPVINILDPDIVIVGGGVGNIDALYKDGPAEIRKYLFNDVLNTQIVKPKLGDSAGVFGAAMLVA